MSPHDQFRLLAGLSLADGQLQPEERGALLRAAGGLGLGRDEAGDVLRDVMAGGKVSNLSPPDDPIARGVLFQQMVELVAADGEVSPQERVILQRLAGPFGVELAKLEGIVAGALAGVSGGGASPKPVAPKVKLLRPGASNAAARRPKPQPKLGALSCPSCGALVEFKSPRSVAIVCEYCDTTVVRQDSAQALEDAGKVSFLVPDASPIRIGARGEAFGVEFTVLGRLQVEHATGYWNEWFLEWADRKTGWLGEALGQYYVTLPGKDDPQAREPIPEFADLSVGQQLFLDGERYTVTEVRVARATGTEGETPFVVKEGYTLPYADLRREDFGFATIDYSEDPPLLFVGRSVPWRELKMRGHRRFDGWRS